jgi:hypothetical protein
MLDEGVLEAVSAVLGIGTEDANRPAVLLGHTRNGAQRIGVADDRRAIHNGQPGPGVLLDQRLEDGVGGAGCGRCGLLTNHPAVAARAQARHTVQGGIRT